MNSSEQFPSDEAPWTTVSVTLGSQRRYTYKCELPVEVGDVVSVKLSSGQVFQTPVLEVHTTPQLSDKWETKWSVVVKTKAQLEAERNQPSELGAALGLGSPNWEAPL